MANLLDIAPSMATTTVAGLAGDQTQEVRGLSSNAVASIISRFPDVGLLLGGSSRETMGLQLIAQCGGAIGPIIAAGCGHLDDKQYEQRASELLIEDQLKLIDAILRLSFPNGFAPFIQSVTTLVTTVTALFTDAEGGGTEKPLKIRSRKLPSALPPSSDEASPPTMQ